MADIVQEIYCGLHGMAMQTADQSQNNLACSSSQSSEFFPKKTHLEVDTTLRAEFCGDPKALGMDSSGFPIDSADYERAGYLSSVDCVQEGTAVTASSSSEDLSPKSR
ncbi:unnamed protein product [Gongylonema pulchrum]|uniref:Uncharacterized protein n=1 Tax=Gongylonema pulchrum TaxID=637853 RepID=A0A183EKJ0_9BILA|nr:unnamed protein product [Gongylonema pulchrum]